LASPPNQSCAGKPATGTGSCTHSHRRHKCANTPGFSHTVSSKSQDETLSSKPTAVTSPSCCDLGMPRRRLQKWNKFSGAILGIFVASQFAWLHLHQRLIPWDDRADDLQSSAWFPSTTTLAMYSQVHCVGDNFLPLAWTFRSCQYRNLYFAGGTGINTTQNWTLYPSPTASRLHMAWKNARNSSTDYSRFSTSFVDMHVLPAAVHASDRRKRDGHSWAPDVEWIRGEDHRHLSKPPTPVTILDRIVVPIFIKFPPPSSGQDPYSVFLLTTQILLPIYNLLGLFGWQNKTNLVDVVLLKDHPSNNCNLECQQWLRTGIEVMLGYRFVGELDTAASFRSPIICYRRGAAGMGFLSVQGLSKRGLEPRDYQEPRVIHNAGRGRTFWEFVLHVWNLQGFSLLNQAPSVVQVQLAFSQNGSEIEKKLIQSLTDSFASDSFVHVDRVFANTSTISELVRLGRNSRVWVVDAKDDHRTWPAFFMPRGSTLCLLYDNAKGTVLESSGHGLFPDFGFWNHVSHLDVHWLALPRTLKGLSRLSRLLQSLIMKHTDALDNVSIGTSHQTLGQTSDWTFQKHPVKWIPRSPSVSQAHCLGENWERDSVNYRSCWIRNLCFDPTNKEFVFLSNASIADLATSGRDFLATTLRPVMTGQTIRFGTARPWSPRKVSTQSSSGHYSLPSNVFWLPYFAEVPNANNPGHLLWDFMLPLYTLMEMYVEDDARLLLTNLDTNCIAAKTKHACFKLTQKFLPLLGVDPASFVHAQGAGLQISDEDGESVPGPLRPGDLVCSSNAAIGIGVLNDHGIKKHGQLIIDYQTVRNCGRGMAFWRFRNYMIGNSREQAKKETLNSPFVITFSINSSHNPSRNRDFMAQIQHLQKQYPYDRLKIQAVELASRSIDDQLSIISKSSIFISVIGGAASTAMFLERNACLILYFNDEDDYVRENGRITSMPAMLDWDFWNHASYLRVHWLPLSTVDNVSDLVIFSRLIEAELDSVW